MGSFLVGKQFVISNEAAYCVDAGHLLGRETTSASKHCDVSDVSTPSHAAHHALFTN